MAKCNQLTSLPFKGLSKWVSQLDIAKRRLLIVSRSVTGRPITWMDHPDRWLAWFTGVIEGEERTERESPITVRLRHRKTPSTQSSVAQGTTRHATEHLSVPRVCWMNISTFGGTVHRGLRTQITVQLTFSHKLWRRTCTDYWPGHCSFCLPVEIRTYCGCTRIRPMIRPYRTTSGHHIDLEMFETK